MKTDPIVFRMSNTLVMADETYIGGLEKNKSRLERDTSVHGRHRGAKTPVSTLIDAQTGESRSVVIPNATGATFALCDSQESGPERVSSRYGQVL